MTSRSVLGCQHPCVLVLGLALALLCGTPCAEAGGGGFQLLESIPDPNLLATPYGDELAGIMHQAMVDFGTQEFQQCYHNHLEAYGGLPPELVDENDVQKTQWYAALTRMLAVGTSAKACLSFLDADKQAIILYLYNHPYATPNEIREATQNWVDKDNTGERESKVENLIVQVIEVRTKYIGSDPTDWDPSDA